MWDCGLALLSELTEAMADSLGKQTYSNAAVCPRRKEETTTDATKPYPMHPVRWIGPHDRLYLVGWRDIEQANASLPLRF